MATQREIDPTQTLTLRRRYQREIARRLDVIRRSIGEAVGNRDMLGLNTPSNQFRASEEAIGDMLRFLQEQIDLGLFELVTPEGDRIANQSVWQTEFIEDGYIRGLRHAEAQLSLELTPTAPLSVTIDSPVHTDRVEALIVRSFIGVDGDPTKPGLLGLENALRERIRDVLTISLVEGEGSDQAAKRIMDAVDRVSEVEAQRIARTQIIGAHAEGTLTELQLQGERNVRPLAEFTTAGDERVCETCLAIETTDRFGLGQGIFPIENAFGVIPAHPNCRCAWLPAGIGEDTTLREQRLRRSRERLQELTAEAA